MTTMMEGTAAGTGPVLYSGMPGMPGTSDTALYTASRPGVILGGIFCQNITGSDAQLTLTVHRASSGAVEGLVTDLHIPAGSAGPAIDMALRPYSGVLLLPGDSLHGTASPAAAVTVTAHE
jgi:hypothetical protein